MAGEETFHSQLREKIDSITFDKDDKIQSYGWTNCTDKADNFRNTRMPILTIPKAKVFEPSKAADYCESNNITPNIFAGNPMKIHEKW